MQAGGQAASVMAKACLTFWVKTLHHSSLHVYPWQACSLVKYISLHTEGRQFRMRGQRLHENDLKSAPVTFLEMNSYTQVPGVDFTRYLLMFFTSVCCLCLLWSGASYPGYLEL